jgi:GNAT superfamily N-acetyltransferase
MDRREIAHCTTADFAEVLEHVAEFWGSDRTLALHHPMLIYEFGDTAYVIRAGDQVIAYLFGLLSQTEPVGYVHLVGVHQGHRREGLARRLYEHFAAAARARGCRELKAITTASNERSLAFHRAFGMEPVGGDRDGEIPIARDYAGPGQDRVVLRMPLIER